MVAVSPGSMPTIKPKKTDKTIVSKLMGCTTKCSTPITYCQSMKNPFRYGSGTWKIIWKTP